LQYTKGVAELGHIKWLGGLLWILILQFFEHDSFIIVLILALLIELTEKTTSRTLENKARESKNPSEVFLAFPSVIEVILSKQDTEHRLGSGSFSALMFSFYDAVACQALTLLIRIWSKQFSRSGKLLTKRKLNSVLRQSNLTNSVEYLAGFNSIIKADTQQIAWRPKPVFRRVFWLFERQQPDSDSIQWDSKFRRRWA
jgi:hypothetical protein